MDDTAADHLQHHGRQDDMNEKTTNYMWYFAIPLSCLTGYGKLFGYVHYDWFYAMSPMWICVDLWAIGTILAWVRAGYLLVSKSREKKHLARDVETIRMKRAAARAPVTRRTVMSKHRTRRFSLPTHHLVGYTSTAFVFALAGLGVGHQLTNSPTPTQTIKPMAASSSASSSPAASTATASKTKTKTKIDPNAPHPFRKFATDSYKDQGWTDDLASVDQGPKDSIWIMTKYNSPTSNKKSAEQICVAASQFQTEQENGFHGVRVMDQSGNKIVERKSTHDSCTP